MGTNALLAAIEDDLSRGGMHSAAADNNTSHIRIFGRGRNGVALSGDALPHELDQGQRETLAVGQPTEQHVQDAQGLRKVGFVRHLLIFQVEAA